MQSSSNTGRHKTNINTRNNLNKYGWLKSGLSYGTRGTFDDIQELSARVRTCHWWLRLGWASGWFWRCSSPGGSVPEGWSSWGTPACPSSPSWRWSLRGGRAPRGTPAAGSLHTARGLITEIITVAVAQGSWRGFFDLFIFTFFYFEAPNMVAKFDD